MKKFAVEAKPGVKKEPGEIQIDRGAHTWQMEFPGGILADCRCSYSGWFELSPAYACVEIRNTA